MGTGKTSVARKAAQACEMPFGDSDALVSHMAGKTISEIFDEDGEEAFRDLEHQALSDLLSSHKPSVISTGGGAVLREDNRRLLKQHSKVVWMLGDINTIASRLTNSPNPRPLVPKGDADEMRATIARIQNERQHLYEAVADIALDVSQIGQFAAIQAVIESAEAIRNEDFK